MIYLIDDKKQRQEGFGWDDMKISQFKQFLRPIYNYEQILEENLRDLIFSPGSIVLFHESFFETTSNKHEKDSIAIRTELEKYSKKEDADFSLAIFSGSKNSRSHEKNVINLPVGTLYTNLEIFINKYANGNKDLRFLLFGENPEIEEYLTQTYETAKQNLDNLPNYESAAKNLYLKPYKDFIQKPLQIFDEQTIYKVSDTDLSEKLLEWLNTIVYDNIFIPLCFGPVLSDYNGLRLALHIRTTATLNQFANIFIYGPVGHSNLLQNEYYDVLKTKNVRLIGYNRLSFKDALFLKLPPFLNGELSDELDRIKLKPPKNYEDSHSIANEWSIMRWFKTLNSSGVLDYIPDEIESLEANINSNLYFKYLTSKFPIDQTLSISETDLKLKYSGKILYIDDESDKGWNELFCSLFWDGVINKVENYDNLGSELKELDRDAIINLCVRRAKDFDVVILDFRLVQDDFYESDPKKVTGFQILQKIKEYNKGIQVVVFSATNKVWNLQALQEAGADGFIIKESAENSVDKEFTKESIINIIDTIDKCFKMSFLKTFVELMDAMNTHFDENSPTIFNEQSNQIENNFSRFQNEIINQMTIAFDCLYNSKNNLKNEDFNSKYLDLALVSLYKILELFNKEFIHDVQPILTRYVVRDLDKQPATLDKTAYVIQERLNMDLNGIINNLIIYNDMRNDIIHPKKNRRQRKPIPSDCIQFAQIIKQLVFKTE